MLPNFVHNVQNTKWTSIPSWDKDKEAGRMRPKRGQEDDQFTNVPFQRGLWEVSLLCDLSKPIREALPTF